MADVILARLIGSYRISHGSTKTEAKETDVEATIVLPILCFGFLGRERHGYQESSEY